MEDFENISLNFVFVSKRYCGGWLLISKHINTEENQRKLVRLVVRVVDDSVWGPLTWIQCVILFKLAIRMYSLIKKHL